MCTLTYLLNDNGYELFFNRDEQRSRLLAVPPKFNQAKNAIYPVDPQEGGTWIAVTQQGLSLALLNNYQALFNNNKNRVSRGQLILSLLQTQGDIIKQLKSMDLSIYQPFQLCVFPENLSIKNQTVHSIMWTGKQLCTTGIDLPITSSSIDFDEVCQKRKRRFNNIIDTNEPLSHQHKHFHFSTEATGKYSVNMHRADAITVSISHVCVNHKISFEYFDNVLNEDHTITLAKEKRCKFAS